MTRNKGSQIPTTRAADHVLSQRKSESPIYSSSDFEPLQFLERFLHDQLIDYVQTASLDSKTELLNRTAIEYILVNNDWTFPMAAMVIDIASLKENNNISRNLGDLAIGETGRLIRESISSYYASLSEVELKNVSFLPARLGGAKIVVCSPYEQANNPFALKVLRDRIATEIPFSNRSLAAYHMGFDLSLNFGYITVPDASQTAIDTVFEDVFEKMWSSFSPSESPLPQVENPYAPQADYFTPLLNIVDTDQKALMSYARKVSCDRSTGLLMHDGVVAALEHLVSLEPLTLFAIDIIGMSHINEKFSRAVGNKVILSVADALRRSTRKGDLVARLGGDEFGAFIPRVSANAVKERFYTQLEVKLSYLPDGLADHLVRHAFGDVTTRDYNGLIARVLDDAYRAVPSASIQNGC